MWDLCILDIVVSCWKRQVHFMKEIAMNQQSGAVSSIWIQRSGVLFITGSHNLGKDGAVKAQNHEPKEQFRKCYAISLSIRLRLTLNILFNTPPPQKTQRKVKERQEYMDEELWGRIGQMNGLLFRTNQDNYSTLLS